MRGRNRIVVAVGLVALVIVVIVACRVLLITTTAPSDHRFVHVTPRWPDGSIVTDALVHGMLLPANRALEPVPAELPRHTVWPNLPDGSAPLQWTHESLGEVLVRSWRLVDREVVDYGETILPAGAPERSHFSVVLRRERTLHIRVVDGERHTVAGVELHAIGEVQRDDGTVAAPTCCATARTDEDGEATFFHAQSWLHRFAVRDGSQPFVVRAATHPDVTIDLDASDLPEHRITLQIPATAAHPAPSPRRGANLAAGDALGDVELVAGRIDAPRGVDDVRITVVDTTRDTDLASSVTLKPDGTFVVRGRAPDGAAALVVTSREHRPLERTPIRRGETGRLVTLVPRPAIEVPFRIASRELAVCLDYVLVRDDGTENSATRRVWNADGVMTCRFLTDGLGPHRVVVRPKARKNELLASPLVIAATDDRAAPLAVPAMRVLHVAVPGAIGEGTTEVRQLVAGVPIESVVQDGSSTWLVASDEPIDLRIRVPGYHELVAPNVNADFAKMLEPK